MRAMQHLSDTVLHLIDQGTESVLALRCRDLDVPIVHKVIEQVDQLSPSDVCLSFGHAAKKSRRRYIDVVMDSLETQIVGVNVLRKDAGLPPWELPPIGSGLCSEERMALAFEHVGGLVGTADDHRVVWCFVPPAIEDPITWSEFCALFFSPTLRQPGHRVVLRVDDLFAQALSRSDLLSAYVLHVDFSPEAMVSELVGSVLDPKLDDASRTDALLQLAGHDFSHRRFAEAAKKYATIYERCTGAPGIQAMCLLAVGDIARIVGDTGLAKRRYQSALALATDDVSSLPVAMMAASNLGDLPLLVDEAVGYLELASTIAGKLCNAPFKTFVMEKIGILHARHGKPQQAYDIWSAALALARDDADETRVASLQEHLATVLT